MNNFRSVFEFCVLFKKKHKTKLADRISEYIVRITRTNAHWNEWNRHRRLYETESEKYWKNGETWNLD